MKSLFIKLVFFSLVSVYVLTTVGVSVISHYCCGELEKVSLFSKPTSCCEGQDEDEDGCCSNDVKYVSFQSDFTFYKLVNTCKASVKDLFAIFSSSENFYLENNCHYLLVFDTNIHPPNLVQHTIISSSVIRI